LPWQARTLESQGWTLKQTAAGPPKYIDNNGVERLVIKRGSSRTPGSENPHVEVRNKDAQRIDPFGNKSSKGIRVTMCLSSWTYRESIR